MNNKLLIIILIPLILGLFIFMWVKIRMDKRKALIISFIVAFLFLIIGYIIGYYLSDYANFAEKYTLQQQIENLQNQLSQLNQQSSNNLPIGYTLERYTIAKTLDTTCIKDNDCETPPEYLVLSNCPYTSICLENRCNVVCPDYIGADKKINTSDWQTYRNELGGYEVMYPIDCNPTIVDKKILAGKCGGIEVFEHEFEKDWSIEEFMDGVDATYSNKEIFYIKEYKGVKADYSGILRGKSAIIKKDDKFYNIYIHCDALGMLQEECSQMFDKIVGSFQFTD